MHDRVAMLQSTSSDDWVRRPVVSSKCRDLGEVLPRTRPLSRWYYHAGTPPGAIDDCSMRWFREFLTHGAFWTGDGETSVHHSQRLAVKPLKPQFWPRDPLGPSWPSFPTITEWMEMLRKGLDPFERGIYENPKGDLGFTQVSRRQVQENPALASRIVTNNIVGIRSSVEVPRKFLKYFRYHQNFLILVVRHNLPIGLVRFLLGRWCVAPYSLWLRRAVLFKKFLKKVPSLHVKRAELWLTTQEESWAAKLGRCTPSADFSSEYDSGGESELD